MNIKSILNTKLPKCRRLASVIYALEEVGESTSHPDVYNHVCKTFDNKEFEDLLDELYDYGMIQAYKEEGDISRHYRIDPAQRKTVKNLLYDNVPDYHCLKVVLAAVKEIAVAHNPPFPLINGVYVHIPYTNFFIFVRVTGDNQFEVSDGGRSTQLQKIRISSNGVKCPEDMIKFMRSAIQKEMKNKSVYTKGSEMNDYEICADEIYKIVTEPEIFSAIIDIYDISKMIDNFITLLEEMDENDK
jgi:hypothetical protein